jgi:AbrB family looped-hinge helix DNA binding protein
MNAQTKMSEKGQVVIPKDVRSRLGLLPGDRLEVVERPDGVLLRKAHRKSEESYEAITTRLRARIRYDGPPVSVGEMNEAIEGMSAAGGPRWSD